MMSNIEPIIGIVFAMLILGERISALQEAGIALVFVSIIIMEMAA